MVFTVRGRPYEVKVELFPDGERMAYRPVAVRVERYDDEEISPSVVKKLPLTALTKVAKALVPQVQADLVDPTRRGGSVEIDVDELDKAARRPEQSRYPRDTRREYEEFVRNYQRIEAECGGIRTNEAAAEQMDMTANAVAQKKWRAKSRYGIDI